MLEVGLPHGECLLAMALNCNPWNSVCGNAKDASFPEPRSSYVYPYVDALYCVNP